MVYDIYSTRFIDIYDFYDRSYNNVRNYQLNQLDRYDTIVAGKFCWVEKLCQFIE